MRTRGFVVAVAVLVLDQLAKWWVTGPLGIDRPGDALDVLPIFRLAFVRNFGVSLGLLHAGSDTARWALVGLTAAISAGVVAWILNERNRQDILALGLVLGGAVGNIVDRVRLGYVVDYADLHFGDWSPFLVFNVGDAGITIGVLILLIRAVFVRDDGPKRSSIDA